ncbi:PAS domain S-box protein [Sesbania bispinosa]|nr:PAS domain S-box protein [Sesbania bispinosa]
MRLLSPRRLSSSAHRPSPSPTVSVLLPPSLSVLLPVPPSFTCACWNHCGTVLTFGLCVGWVWQRG